MSMKNLGGGRVQAGSVGRLIQPMDTEHRCVLRDQRVRHPTRLTEVLKISNKNFQGFKKNKQNGNVFGDFLPVMKHQNQLNQATIKQSYCCFFISMHESLCLHMNINFFYTLSFHFFTSIVSDTCNIYSVLCHIRKH